MPDTLMNLPGKLTATGALAVTASGGVTTGGPLRPIGQLLCRVTSDNRLVVAISA